MLLEIYDNYVKNSIYNFVKYLNCFKCDHESCSPKEYYNLLSKMSIEELNNENDLIEAFKYQLTYLSNKIVSDLYIEIEKFDENNLKESFGKLFKIIEKYNLEIYDILSGKKKLNIIEEEAYEELEVDHLFAYATTVIGADIFFKNDLLIFRKCFGLFDDLINLLDSFTALLIDLFSSVINDYYKEVSGINKAFASFELGDDFIEEFSNFSLKEPKILKNEKPFPQIFDDNGNIIPSNVKCEVCEVFCYCLGCYNLKTRFFTTALLQIDFFESNFRFFESEFTESTFKFMSDLFSRSILGESKD